MLLNNLNRKRAPREVRPFSNRIFYGVITCASRWQRAFGIPVGTFLADADKRHNIQAKMSQALQLMAKHDPCRFRYLQRDAARILVFGTSAYRGEWVESLKLCQLYDSYVLDAQTTPAMIAAILAHEAMHARLIRWGIGYDEAVRVRVEQICCRAMITFAQRLPDTEQESREKIIQEARQQITRNPAYWTNKEMIATRLAILDHMEGPDWLLRLAKWNLRRQQSKYL